MATVLIIDDNEAVRAALEMLFSLHDLRAVGAASPEEGLRVLGERPVDLVVQDMNFAADTTSGAEGIGLFGEIRRRHPDLPVILLTAWTSLETAVELVKAGAADYLGKPWDDDKLLTTARNLLRLREATLERHRLEENRRRTRAALRERFDLCDIVYDSDVMHELLVTATRIAPAAVPVLITGENGVGKEKLADVVQANSACREGPYVKVNVGALPQDLMEAELFGAEAGAYTGSQKLRRGRFETADGGTLFLDEIGNLPPDGQAKLLRVLQTGEFERLGSSATRKVDVRVISATNADLKASIAHGAFREDLYYRLNVIELLVPPLAERTEDIRLLAEAFLDERHVLSAEARRALQSHPWPGNVRELHNCIQRACLLAPDRSIGVGDLALKPEPAAPATGDGPDRAVIETALRDSDGVVARAARRLGLSRQALYRRMDKFDIPRD